MSNNISNIRQEIYKNIHNKEEVIVKQPKKSIREQAIELWEK